MTNLIVGVLLVSLSPIILVYAVVFLVCRFFCEIGERFRDALRESKK